MSATMVVREQHDYGLTIDLEISRVLLQTQTEYQEVLIAETEAFGRGLFLDRTAQSFELDEGVYHAALVHPAMFHHRAPKRVLVAGGGEGATVREVLRHPGVEAVSMVDIDGELVQACRRLLPQWHQGCFDDPRVAVAHADIRSWLQRVEPGSFDVLIHDLGDPMASGPARLAFTLEFFQMVDRILGPDGVLVIQAGEFDHGTAASYNSLLATLDGVFAHTRPYRRYVHSFNCEWGFVLASQRELAVSPAGIEDRWEAAGGRTWDHYDPEGHRAMMWLSPAMSRWLDRDAPVLTDAAPLEDR